MGDIVTITLVIIIICCSTIVYWNNYKNIKKYKNIHYKGELSGFEIAEKILENNGLDNIYIVETHNYLEERYDINRNVIRLLPSSFHGLSIIDGLTAAFLAGHAIFDKKKKLLHIRNILSFIVNILIYVSYGCIIIAAFIKNYEYLKLGIFSLFILMLFHFITLPLEKEIGSFVVKSIKELNLIDDIYIEVLEKITNDLSYRYISSPIILIVALINLLKNNN